jgi:hypothetical protein
MEMEYVYRVIVKTTDSLRPRRGTTTWSQNVVYCGLSLRDARVAYLREVASDYNESFGPARVTKIERHEAEPDNIHATHGEPIDADTLGGC